MHSGHNCDHNYLTPSRLRARLLTCTALVAAVLTSIGPAAANDMTLGGAGPFTITLPFSGTLLTDIVVNVDTSGFSFGSISLVSSNQYSQTINVFAGSTLDAVDYGYGILATGGKQAAAEIDGAVFASSGIAGAGAGVTLDTVGASPGSGDISVTGVGSVISTTDAAVSLTADTGNITLSGLDGGVSGQTYAVLTTALTGATQLTVNGSVFGGNSGFDSTSTSGNITQIANSSVTATTGSAFYAASGTGNVTQIANGTVSAGAYGFFATTTTGYVEQSGAGGAVTAGSDAYHATTTTGAIAQYAAGATVAGQNGFYASSSSGQIAVGSNSTVNAGANGVYAETGGAGSVLVATSGLVTAGGNGVQTAAANGATNISTGAINAGAYGVLATATGTGSVNVTNNGAITAAAAAIFTDTTAGSGATTVNVGADVNNPGTGTSVGVQTNSGSGDAVVNIASGATVSGGLAGVIASAGAGTTVVNNYGVITSAQPAGATYAFEALSGTGQTILDNYGVVTGIISSSGSDFTFNNAGVFAASPGTHTLGAASNVINNSGVVALNGAGLATLAGSATLNNLAGGVIILANSAQAGTNSLGVQNLASSAGSTIVVNYNANAANTTGLGYDNTNTGKGTTDALIVTGVATAAAGAKIDLISSTYATASLTGSAAIVYTGTNLAAPSPNAKLVSSSYYSFSSANPSSGRSLFSLVDDGAGGVFLQWVPNLSAPSLGGYLGGAPGASSTAGDTIAMGAAGFAGLGGGFDGVTTGVGGRIADAASANASASGLSAANCSVNDGWSAWGQIDAAGQQFSGGGVGRSYAGTLGLERDLSGLFDASCGHLAAGAFGVNAKSSFNYNTGDAQIDSAGGGGYLRASSESGIYGDLMGAATSSSSNITNAIYNSTAKQGGLNSFALADAGFAADVSERIRLDTRVFGAYGQANGAAFTDSWGVRVSGSENALTSVGVLEGVSYIFAPGSAVFVRGGYTSVEDAQSITAFGVRQAGTAHATYESVEGGFTRAYGDMLVLSVSGFGAFSSSAITYGGLGRMTMNF